MIAVLRSRRHLLDVRPRLPPSHRSEALRRDCNRRPRARRLHKNVLGVDTGVHIDERGYGRPTNARIDAREIETVSFVRCAEDANVD